MMETMTIEGVTLISANGRLRMPPDGAMRVPVEFYLSKSLLPEAIELERLAEIAAHEKVYGRVVVLPDVHFKEKNFIPSGVVVPTEGGFVPEFASPPNDAMALLATSVDSASLTRGDLDRIFEELRGAIEMYRRDEPAVGENLFLEILRKGVGAVAEAYEISDDDRANIEREGSAFPDGEEPEPEEIVEAFRGFYGDDRPPHLFEYVPTYDVVEAGRRCLGVLDGGSHFLEFCRVDKIFKEDHAEVLGLSMGQLLVALHAAAADVGIIANRAYLPADGNSGFTYLPLDEPDGKRFLIAMSAASNFAYVNRAYILHQVRRILNDVLGDDVICSLVSDVSHDLIEPIKFSGAELCLHRKGAVRALPAEECADHPRFSKTGIPFYFPSALGGAAYLMANPIGQPDTFYTTSHGSGRRMKVDAAIEAYTPEEVEAQAESGGAVLYRFGKTRFGGQAPQSYKSMDGVLATLGELHLAEPIARLQPVAMLKA